MQAFIVALLFILSPVLLPEASAAEKKQVRTPVNRMANIPTVSGRLFEKKDHFEMTLWTENVVDNPFHYQAPIGLGLGYHVAESLSLGLRGSYWLAFERGPMASPGNVPEPEIARVLFEGYGEIVWAPVYGKWSFLSKLFVHFDAHIKLGGGVVGTQDGDLSPLITFAVGQRYRLADWFLLSVEIRERVVKLDSIPSAAMGADWEYLLSLGVGASFMFGGSDS
jgi:outer membrane beta-barrel protein